VEVILEVTLSAVIFVLVFIKFGVATFGVDKTQTADGIYIKFYKLQKITN
jgi:hypothetical protein